MSFPIVAVVGRPNVGKSTFVNRITRVRDAIVHEMRGVTRDRAYYDADWNGVSFRLVDTGGIELGDDDAFQASIRNQALEAAREADVVIFLVDGTTGISSDDGEVARILRRASKPVMLVVNKMDNPARMDEVWEFYQLGLGDPWAISALHGTGTGDLLDALVEHLRECDYASEDDLDTSPINIAIIGRPNAGKSSLVNKLTNNNRAIVSDVAGTTRDAIDTTIEHNGVRYTIVDTAGLRRKAKIDEDVEYYSFVRAMRAIDKADVALLVIDSTVGLTDQDQRVANFALERSCAAVVVLNKWDAVGDTREKKQLREHVADRLAFVAYAPVVAISALTGKNVHAIWKALDEVYANYSSHISTSRLNAWLRDVCEQGHSVVQGRKTLRLKYMTQTSSCPPRFTIFANHPEIVTDNFRRFLENRMRESFDLAGTPIFFKFKKRTR